MVFSCRCDHCKKSGSIGININITLESLGTVRLTEGKQAAATHSVSSVVLPAVGQSSSGVHAAVGNSGNLQQDCAMCMQCSSTSHAYGRLL